MTLSCSQIPPPLLQARMTALQQLLFIPTQRKAVSLVLRQPQLLNYSSETLRAHLEALRCSLRVSSDAALLVVIRHPNILCLRPQLVQVNHVKHMAG